MFSDFSCDHFFTHELFRRVFKNFLIHVSPSMFLLCILNLTWVMISECGLCDIFFNIKTGFKTYFSWPIFVALPCMLERSMWCLVYDNNFVYMHINSSLMFRLLNFISLLSVLLTLCNNSERIVLISHWWFFYLHILKLFVKYKKFTVMSSL